MTDHGATETIPNWTENDKALAHRFGITLENIFVTKVNEQPPKPPYTYMLMNLNPNLPGDLSYLANQVQGISAHDSCIMLPPANFTSLATFPPGATAFDISKGHDIPLPNQYFSIFVPFDAGKVIVVGNSGMMGDYGSPNPAAGLIPLENNLMFFLNCVSYLGGITCIPDPGQVPCVKTTDLSPAFMLLDD